MTIAKILVVVMIVGLCTGLSFINSGTLIGEVGVYEGNCMPSPGVPPCEPQPLSALLYITQPGEKFNPEKVVDSVRSDRKGRFSLELAAGDYSIFVKDGNQITCTVTSCPAQCYCLPIKVRSDSITRIEVTLDHATW